MTSVHAEPVPCIYCGQLFDPSSGEGDHILPAGVFGEFRGDRRFRGVCASCNNAIGASEQVLAQGSPLGFYRQIVKPPDRRGRPPRGGLGSAAGARHPEFRTTYAGWTIGVHPDREDPRNCVVFPQMIVRDAAGEDHPIRLYPNMSAVRLREEIARAGITEVREAVILCPEDQFEHLRQLLQTEFPTSHLESPETIVEPTEGQFIRGEYRVGVAYFQAMAKIAFHYYLAHTRRGYRGSEPAFEPIRNFVRSGGAPEGFFHADGQIIVTPIGRLPDGTFRTAAQWCHLLGVVEIERSAVVHLQLFAGPHYAPKPTFVTLGRFESRLIVPKAAWGHAFIYDDSPIGRQAGRVVEVEMLPLRRT